MLPFIEAHSVFVGIVSTLIVGSLWYKKFINQKRAEAFFGFYTKLLLQLKLLKQLLNDTDQLNYSDNKKGNIYALLYDENTIKEFYPDYVFPPNNLEKLKDVALEIKKTLLETDNNVYPYKTDKSNWYNSQYVLLSFCEFITDENNFHSINQDDENATGEKKHILKCKKLVHAMDYLMNSIESARY